MNNALKVENYSEVGYYMNHYYKKGLSSLLALSLLTLSACSSETGTSSPSASSGGSGSTSASSNQSNNEVVQLKLWHYYNNNTKDALDVIISEFNDTVGLEKNIHLEAFSYSSVNDLATAVVAAGNKEVGMADMPDIFSAYSDTALLLHDMGVVASMDSYFSAQELALFQQDFLNEGRFDEDGQLRIIPVAKSTELLFINDTDFQVFAEETGAEQSEMETWEGLVEVAEAYYHWTDEKTPDVDYDGSALFGVDSESNFLLLAARQLGEEMYLYEGEQVYFGLSEEAAKKIWEILFVPYIKGYYGSFGSYRSDDVRSGDILAYVGSTSSVYYFPTSVEKGRAEAYDIVGTTMAYPYFEKGEQVTVQQGAGMLVAKNGEAQEAAAAEFLKWFTSAEYNLNFAVSTGYIPVQNDALSLDGVMEVMESNTEGEIPSIVSHSMEITYNQMLPEYEFYTSKPFHGSYDTRNALKTVTEDTIAGFLATYDEMLESGSSREEVLESLTGEEAFLEWYEFLKETINTIMEDYN